MFMGSLEKRGLRSGAGTPVDVGDRIWAWFWLGGQFRRL